MHKCLTHAVALNEKALIPTVPGKQKTNTVKPTHLTALHLKMYHILGLFITAQNSKSQNEIKRVF